MKKLIVTISGILMALSLTGCAGTGTQLEKISTADAPNADTIKASDYKDNLEGLENYLKALQYIPENAAKTDMMSNVIGAKEGHRYNFIVNNSTIFVELYEYEPDNLGEEGQRVIDEITKNGEFYVFSEDTNLDGNVAYPAALSENGKYMVLYTDSSSDINNIQRQEDFKQAVKKFYS